MRRTLARHEVHPRETELLLFIDGELHARAARTIGLHLQGCRRCRTKIQILQAGLQTFAAYRQAAVLPAAGAPPRGWSDFSTLL
jgi:hypothetical protein